MGTRATMAKITSFLRVTKKRKTPDQKLKPVAKAPRVIVQHVEPVKPEQRQKSCSPSSDEDQSAGEEHVAEFIHQTVKYQRKGQDRQVARQSQAILAHIEYGPLSGLTYESRLIRAYSLGLLSRKPTQQSTPPQICTTCSKLGHSYKLCPDGF
ncbi:TPA: hypothetical protein N0F65_002068 [Lagenidium giganteum]|uniref:CCHC-type domain-containing protein n=1 Tax=Lagenidium giganteum TaxID=4803 RepID=A0AAV2ZDD9_9STRA|nr:TPA: hypothetical protein N0F65_002068 [Lagenidium giganteum]